MNEVVKIALFAYVGLGTLLGILKLNDHAIN